VSIAWKIYVVHGIYLVFFGVLILLHAMRSKEGKNKEKEKSMSQRQMIRRGFLMVLMVAVGITTCFVPSPAKEEGWHSEEIYTVMSAQSLNNLYQGILLPHNPGLADNNWGSPHQDSYCSESVSLHGPISGKLRVIRQFNPYGFTPCMVCNSSNQMIGITFSKMEQVYRLIVFDKDCHILSATKTSDLVSGSFGGGYFYLNNNENTVVVGNNRIMCYPTASVERKAWVYELPPVWTSQDIVEMVTGSPDGNTLYSSMPVWDEKNPDLYWCLLAGSYDFTPPGKLNSHAYIAVVKIVPDAEQPNGCTTTLLDTMPLPGQWNNNTFAVDEKGAYFVTNALNTEGVCNDGYLHAVTFDPQSGEIVSRWKYRYENSGYLKTGQKNIGCGTTPTLVDDQDGNKLVAITDNAYPQLNVVVVNRKDGSLVAQIPVFPKMRGCDEASLIGVNNRLVVENNFGHTVEPFNSQYVANEPGMAMIEVDLTNPKSPAEIVWEDNRTCFFAMNMLCRESGVIFAHTADWNDDISATEGGMYYVSAIDSWDGRTIWRIPLGRGRQYCHEYGGIYFNRQGSLYIGTNQYLISIQDYVE